MALGLAVTINQSKGTNLAPVQEKTMDNEERTFQVKMRSERSIMEILEPLTCKR